MRLVHPKPLDNLNIGILFSVVASLINLVVAIILIKNGKKHHAIDIEADDKNQPSGKISYAISINLEKNNLLSLRKR